MIIAIDFDGTCVYHSYPEVGEDCPSAVRVLKRLVGQGHSLVLNTMRSGKELGDAIQWFKDRSIRLDAVQYSLGQTGWTCSPKCYANLYIDDAGLGCPTSPAGKHSRPFVDWVEVEKILIKMGYLKKEDPTQLLENIIKMYESMNPDVLEPSRPKNTMKNLALHIAGRVVHAEDIMFHRMIASFKVPDLGVFRYSAEFGFTFHAIQDSFPVSIAVGSKYTGNKNA